MANLVSRMLWKRRRRRKYASQMPAGEGAAPALISALWNVLFLFFAVGYLPRFLAKLRQAEDPWRLWRERWGIIEADRLKEMAGRRVICIHAVSVGETMAVRKLIDAFLEADENYYLVLTTVTATGQKIAREIKKGKDRLSVFYFPFDWTISVRRFFSAFRPACVLLAETEIWPNFLIEAARFDIPVGLVNARLSPKSARSYGFLKGVMRPVLRCLSFVLAQTTNDAARFAAIGIPREKIEVLGNMKFDNVAVHGQTLEGSAALREEWGYHDTDRIFIAGSTHPGEEEILVRVFKEIRKIVPAFRMILAPRHIDRAGNLRRWLTAQGLDVRLATEGTLRFNRPPEILILDQIGILKDLYQIADIVFVGGSLVRHGGQNPLEAAAYQKPIIHGPHVFNFQEVYQILDQNGGALRVVDESELVFSLKRLLQEASEGRELGKNAAQAIEQFVGATERHVAWIQQFLAKRSLERNFHVGTNKKLFPTGSRRS